MNSVCLKHVSLPNQPGIFDVALSRGKILSIDPASLHDDDDVPSGIPVLDAAGCLLLPGLCDLQASLGQPGNDARETIARATAAARHGGVTRLLAMPDNSPTTDSPAMVRFMQSLLAENAEIHVHLAGCITRGACGDESASVDGMARLGVSWLTDGARVPSNPLLLRRAMQYAQPFGMTFAMYGDYPALSNGAVAHDSLVAWDLGLSASPAIAEEIGLEILARLSVDTGTPVHFQNVSCKGSLEIIRRWKARGAKITASVALHHLVFSDLDIGDFNTNYKVWPPLRGKEDVEALRRALADGTIDTIVTDHRPATEFEKRQDFLDAPAGMANLDVFLPALHHYLVRPGIITWGRLIELCSDTPRKLLGLDPVRIQPGESAELVLFDPMAETLVTPVTQKSKAKNTPFMNQKLHGQVRSSWRGASNAN